MKPYLLVIGVLGSFTAGLLVGANNQPVLVGGGGNPANSIQFPENATRAYIQASSGALKLASGGSNQNLILVPSGTGYLLVNLNAGTPQAPPSSTVAQVVGADATNARLVVDTYGADSSFEGRTASGTAASPTALLINKILVQLGARGYGSTGYAGSLRGRLMLLAAENWSDTQQGTYWQWTLAAPGGTATSAYATLTSTGLRVGDATAPSYNIDVPSDINVGGVFRKGGASAGNGSTITVCTSGACATSCTLIFNGGIRTGGTCP